MARTHTWCMNSSASIAEGRKPWIDAVTAANWTAAGICAHESAMQGGAEITVPSFE